MGEGSSRFVRMSSCTWTEN